MDSQSPARKAPVDPLIGTVVSDRYRIESKLGEGGMGQVYVAEHAAIGRRVALKRLMPEFAQNEMVVERFLREARAAAMAGNEHVVEVFDLGRLPDGSPYLVMELMEGQELRDLMEEVGPMPIGRAVNLVRQTCDALTPVHEKGIVHRDLKPENLFLTKRLRGEDFVKVLDFGISKLSQPGGGKAPKLTSTGMSIGTPYYMSPEQAQGLDSVDPRTDVYAVGVILYELLTGRLPFDSETYAMLIVDIVTKDAPPIRSVRSDVPEELAAVLEKCLLKRPGERFSTVRELADALEPFEVVEGAPQMRELAPTDRPSRAGVSSGTRPSKAAAKGVKTARLGAADPSEPPPKPQPALDDAPSTIEVKGAVGLAERSGPAPSLLIGGAVLALIGVVAMVAVAMLPGESPEPEARLEAPEPVTDPTPPPEADRIAVRILVNPAEARIAIDGQAYPNSEEVRIARSDTPVEVVAELDGYETKEQLLIPDEDLEIFWVLDRAEEAEPEEPARPVGRPTAMASPQPPPAMPAAMTLAAPMQAPAPGMDRGFRDNF